MSAGRLKDGRQRSPFSMVVMLLLAILWTLPTAGLFISSFRNPQLITQTGWWTAALPSSSSSTTSRWCRAPTTSST